MVSRQEQLVCWNPLEEVGAHEPALQLVAAGHLLDERLSQTLSIIDFETHCGASAEQVCQFSRVTLTPTVHQQLRSGLRA